MDTRSVKTTQEGPCAVCIITKGVTKSGNGERRIRNREPETGVWEQVYSGKPHEKSKWKKNEKKKELGTTL